ncbi:MAG: hypothetical protein LBN95_07710 [Prevotellaceae bacterium]|jgi:hypothetical protein|nr:hypothetical protein [Prevotellaceae bacterium]
MHKKFFLKTALILLSVVCLFAACDKNGGNNPDVPKGASGYVKVKGETYGLKMASFSTSTNTDGSHMGLFQFYTKTGPNIGPLMQVVFNTSASVLGEIGNAGFASLFEVAIDFDEVFVGGSWDIMYFDKRYVSSIEEEQLFTDGNLKVSQSGDTYTIEGYCSSLKDGRCEFYFKGKKSGEYSGVIMLQ